MSSFDSKLKPEYAFPFLCGASNAFLDIQKAFDAAIDGLLSQIEAAAKDLFALLDIDFSILDGFLNGLEFPDFPEFPDISLASLIKELLDLSVDSVTDLAKFLAKQLDIELEFGDALKQLGLDIDQLLALIAGGGSICDVVPNLVRLADGSDTPKLKPQNTLIADAPAVGEKTSSPVTNALSIVQANVALAAEEKKYKEAAQAIIKKIKGVVPDISISAEQLFNTAKADDRIQAGMIERDGVPHPALVRLAGRLKSLDENTTTSGEGVELTDAEKKIRDDAREVADLYLLTSTKIQIVKKFIDKAQKPPPGNLHEDGDKIYSANPVLITPSGLDFIGIRAVVDLLQHDWNQAFSRQGFNQSGFSTDAFAATSVKILADLKRLNAEYQSTFVISSQEGLLLDE
ncbi:uncharacterized protein METZ01_LOCUS241557 [marine metagenome]|uniref:Uncharacterized protein n=1 Tax=marine metagenome TaxID=408172 RepID=A0A382HPX4_9ZZZZ